MGELGDTYTSSINKTKDFWEYLGITVPNGTRARWVIMVMIKTKGMKAI